MSLLAELVGQTLDNKYRIEKQLGQGGMGAVYLATHVGTHRPVAVKVISPQFMAHREFVERFKREAEAAGKLRHPNVVNVTDFGFAQTAKSEVAYLVMEYLDGCNLGDILKEEKKLPLSWAVDILEQTCLAVDKAHSHGIIHRDLKPDNIWLEPNERGGFTVKVLDFGLAKLNNPMASVSEDNKIPVLSSESVTSGIKVDAEFQEAVTNVQVIDKEGQTAIQIPMQKAVKLNTNNGDSNGDEEKTAVQVPVNKQDSALSDEEKTVVQPPARVTKGNTSDSTQELQKLTQVGAVLGTPIYMSPEQCLGESLDKRTDIYSLGVIAYEMLAGEVPFKGNFNALMVQHVGAPAPSLHEKRSDIPKAVAELVMSTLNKKPEDRPVSAGAFANALRARSEGAGSVMRQALGVYTEHFSKFFQISLIGSIPIILIGILGSLQMAGRKLNIAGSSTLQILTLLQIGCALLNVITARALNSGVSIPILAQILIAPLKEISIAPAVEMLKKRLKMFLPISIFFSISEITLMLAVVFFLFILVFAGYAVGKEFIELGKVSIDRGLIKAIIVVFVSFVLTVVTGKVFFNYSLYASVIMMEGIGGFKALKQSKNLIQKAKRIAIPILFGYLIYLTSYSIIMAVINRYIVLNISSAILAIFITIVVQVLNIVVFILINPLIAICLGLIYFKAHQTNGESLKDILGKYQPEALELSNWQKRIARNPSSLLDSLKRTNS